MKTRYTKSQIVDAINFWHNELLRESLEPKTEAKLKEAAKVFAKAIGTQIKARGMFRFEDGETPDPLVAIKTTIKKGVSVDNCKKELKKLGMPAEVIDQMAKGYSEWFSKNIFGGDKKAIDNLLKTTEQFNYFANVVFGIWHRDPVLSKLLKKNPPIDDSAEDKETVDEGESFRANGNEDAALDETDAEDASKDKEDVSEGEEELKESFDEEDLNRAVGLAPDEQFCLLMGGLYVCKKNGDDIRSLSPEEMQRYTEWYEAHPLDTRSVNERDDRFGGFGGYGRKYSSYGSSAPRGAAIGWYCVADVDPACKNMDRNWRFGPIEFTRGVVDFLYPERQYKRGATMLRHKHFKMPNDGDVVELYVGIASIFDAVKNNDEEALKKLDMLGINRNISLGLDPEDDYSAQYVLR